VRSFHLTGIPLWMYRHFFPIVPLINCTFKLFTRSDPCSPNPNA